jgi:hypothetical protein
MKDQVLMVQKLYQKIKISYDTWITIHIELLLRNSCVPLPSCPCLQWRICNYCKWVHPIRSKKQSQTAISEDLVVKHSIYFSMTKYKEKCVYEIMTPWGNQNVHKWYYSTFSLGKIVQWLIGFLNTTWKTSLCCSLLGVRVCVVLKEASSLKGLFV